MSDFKNIYLMDAVYTTNFETLQLFRRGKVRDVYELENYLMMVATDRISAFDCIMPQPVPGKGKILTEISKFWFDLTCDIVENHLISTEIKDFPKECQPYADDLEGRSMLVKKTEPLPIECVVRGYLAGSGWKEYQQSRTVCGIGLPEGLQESAKLPEPIFTPATKAEEGHDENIPFEKAVELCGRDVAEEAREISLKLYTFAAEYAEQRGVILADTKFEFGLLGNGELILIDEALTPDSSRYWLASEYAPGKAQMNFDKQVLRDYLETLDWNKQPPAPDLPQEVIEHTLAKYREALDRITR
ncbi:MAG TPA: phosphoribosylaminoimidazolesuccinocarboxamide synthase [Patescibacteria group bacterium]|nr:phosphoribosylaminoimidazolesuccinocarboxamide synthase [Patescibacteria group bacterium]